MNAQTDSSAAGFSSADSSSALGSAMQQQSASEAGAGGGAAEGGYESTAREMGWVPKDQFKGDPDKWIDAAEFVDRGNHIMPILQANNRSLRADLLTSKQELATLRESLHSTEKIVKTLQSHYDDATKQEVEKAKKDLRAQLIAAREIGDVEAELDVQDKLDELKKTKTPEVTDSNIATVKTPELHPDFVSWQSENTWFGKPDTDNTIKTLEVLKIGEGLRKDGNTLTGRAFMDRCMQLYELQHRSPHNKVEGSSGGSSSAGSKGRPFLSLPKEAKEVCHSDTHKFVGPGKMFKTQSEWEDHWTNLYLAQG